LGVPAGLFTIIVGHATFCIVVVFNNVTARLRRLGGSLELASADLGAGPWTTFRLVTFPLLRSALVAGALLAFGLSFDEIVVTTFTAGPGTPTLPIWIFNNLFRPNQAPVVNVVAVALVVLSVLPVWRCRVGGGWSGFEDEGASYWRQDRSSAPSPFHSPGWPIEAQPRKACPSSDSCDVSAGRYCPPRVHWPRSSSEYSSTRPDVAASRPYSKIEGPHSRFSVSMPKASRSSSQVKSRGGVLPKSSQ
jgi:hypothetical protein